ncbi:MAG: bifunctional nicotinamidase/pyrazinamidase [Betaproteobacteria bacterium]|nr:MAG: bifunctional nicotinamidase/pyrazinamidase [Betaproteobacteria bacterium]
MSAACLIVVDVQNDFMPGGTLAVPRGDEVVPVINRIAAQFEWIVATQDWHPRAHASFASSHPGRKPFETTRLPYGEQVLWPDHCVQGTAGAALHRDLAIPRAQLIVRKGYRPGVDSYSAFLEADRSTSTGLAAWLRELGIGRLWFCGLATDFCVGWSALDARAAGFEASVIEDACRAIDLDGSLERAWRELRAAGVARARSDRAAP